MANTSTIGDFSSAAAAAADVAAAAAAADSAAAAAAVTAASADVAAAASAATEDTAAADAAAAIVGAAAGNQAVWKRPNMRGSKCSINGYVRLGIVKTIIVELSSVGEDTIREFRESCLGHFIREEWGGFVSNAALHALFSNEVVRPDAQADEFWFRIGRRLIRFSRFEYALVTGMRFGDSDFDIHGDDVHIEGSVYDRYPILSSGGQMLDRIRDRFATGYFRQQSGDALKVAKVLCVSYLLFGFDGGKHIADRWLWTLVEDHTRWESFPWGGYSYQILVTYLREIPIEVPAGLDPSYHFYGNIYAIMIWACEAIPSLGSKCGNILGASFIQRPRCTRWKLKKLCPVSFTTFFDDQIDCFEVLVPTPEEEEEPYMMSISDEASERVQYIHRMPLFKKGVVGRGKGKGKGKGRARDGDSSGRERIVRQRTSGPVISDSPYVIAGRESSVEPHEHVHTDPQRRSSPIRGSHQTASSSARGTEETAHITDLDTLFTQLRQYVDSTAQQIYRYIDTTAQETRRHIDTTAEETRRRMEELFATTQWPFRDIGEFMSSSPHDGSVPTGPRVAQTESIPTADVQGLDHRSLVTTVTPSIIPPPPSLDHQSSVPTVTPSVIPAEMLVTAPEIVPKTRPSPSSADLIPIAFDYATVASRADTYYSPRMQYRSYRPHSPYSSTVVRKRKDLDEEAYCRWLDSDESVNVGAACGASASWFLMLQDGSKLIDAEHLDAYMGILQFDPAFVGVRWLDDWAHQTVLVHTSFLATCINVWNNRKRRKGSSMIDSDDLTFLVNHVHGLRPFWGDHRPWWELREVLTIWNTSPKSSSGHWVLLRIHLEESIICMHDSLAKEEQKTWLNLRGRQATGLSRLIPIVLREAGFYERRLDITPVDSFRVVAAIKDEHYIQDDATSCGAFAIRTLESLIQGSFSHGKTETDIYAFRGRMARAIWRFSDDADSVVCDLTSLFIPVDDVD
ncbi:hypothetical protein OROGR_013636 [Orobanche gracilis]